MFVVSDEGYSCILYRNACFTSITQVYPYSVPVYTTGQRLGYLAIPQIMPAPGPFGW